MNVIWVGDITNSKKGITLYSHLFGKSGNSIVISSGFGPQCFVVALSVPISSTFDMLYQFVHELKPDWISSAKEETSYEVEGLVSNKFKDMTIYWVREVS